MRRPDDPNGQLLHVPRLRHEHRLQLARTSHPGCIRPPAVQVGGRRFDPGTPQYRNCRNPGRFGFSVRVEGGCGTLMERRVRAIVRAGTRAAAGRKRAALQRPGPTTALDRLGSWLATGADLSASEGREPERPPLSRKRASTASSTDRLLGFGIAGQASPIGAKPRKTYSPPVRLTQVVSPATVEL